MSNAQTMNALGYRSIGTGGGCRCWELRLPDCYVLVDDGDLGDDLSAEICIGVYPDDSLETCSDMHTYENFAGALQHLRSLAGRGL